MNHNDLYTQSVFHGCFERLDSDTFTHMLTNYLEQDEEAGIWGLALAGWASTITDRPDAHYFARTMELFWGVDNPFKWPEAVSMDLGATQSIAAHEVRPEGVPEDD